MQVSQDTVIGCRAVCNMCVLVDVSTIRFTQASCGCYLRDGTFIFDLVTHIMLYGVDGFVVHAWYDIMTNRIWTVDHRRIVAMKLASFIMQHDVFVNVVLVGVERVLERWQRPPWDPGTCIDITFGSMRVQFDFMSAVCVDRLVVLYLVWCVSRI